MLDKNKKAPARNKSVEEHYLLTTRLFCGHSNCAMTGMSGKSSTGKIHQYYSCVAVRKHGDCRKKNVQKEYIEDLVANSVLSILSDDYIDDIARKISELSVKKGNTDAIKRLKKLLKENEYATANLIRAIESGKAVDILSAQIEKCQAERADLKTQLAQEKMMRPTLTFEEVKFFFNKFKNGDVSDIAFRTALIDTFINRIYLYDGDDARAEIYCNASNQGMKVPISKLDNSSLMGGLARPMRFERTTFRVGV